MHSFIYTYLHSSIRTFVSSELIENFAILTYCVCMVGFVCDVYVMYVCIYVCMCKMTTMTTSLRANRSSPPPSEPEMPSTGPRWARETSESSTWRMFWKAGQGPNMWLFSIEFVCTVYILYVCMYCMYVKGGVIVLYTDDVRRLKCFEYNNSGCY